MADEPIRVLLRRAAQIYFGKLSLSDRTAIKKGFAALDESKDGRISLREFLKVADRKKDRKLIPKLFAFVDADGSGFIEFHEYVALNYLLDAGLHLCCACASPVIILGYTCRTCWAHQTPSGPSPTSSSSSSPNNASVQTFDLCVNCFASQAFSHPHDDFVDSSTMYHTLLSGTNEETLNLVQCSICGDFHRADIESILMQDIGHVVRSQRSPNDYVCEWCLSWSCNNCGNFFQGPIASARPHKWLSTKLFCKECGEHGDLTNLEPLFKDLQESDICKKCSTCAVKVRNKMLWDSYKKQS